MGKKYEFEFFYSTAVIHSQGGMCILSYKGKFYLSIETYEIELKWFEIPKDYYEATKKIRSFNMVRESYKNLVCNEVFIESLEKLNKGE